jgi:tetratricopeptide (TPR) repeat protein
MPMFTSQFRRDFAALADQCSEKATAVVVYHRTGSAVEEHLNEASLDSTWTRARFRPKMGALQRLGLLLVRFFTGKVGFHQLFVLDTTLPQTGLVNGLDQIVRQLGYEISPQRQVQGSRAELVKRILFTVFAAILVPLLRYAPDVKNSTLWEYYPAAKQLYETLVQSDYFWVVGFLVAAGLFVYLEWQVNLLGLLRAHDDLTSTAREEEFIVDRVRYRRRRGGLMLFFEQPLVFLLSPVFLLLHLGVLLIQALRGLQRLRWLPERVRSWAGRLPVADAWPHFAWVVADLFILFTVWVGWRLVQGPDGRLTWQDPSGAPGTRDFWLGIFFGSVASVTVSTGREILKLSRERKLALVARDRYVWLLAGCVTGLLLLLSAAIAWADPWARWEPLTGHAIGPVLLFLATVMLAWVRWHTQSLKWVLLRIGEVQRLGNDFSSLVNALSNAIPNHLLAVGLWNVDETPATPAGHPELHDPADTPEEHQSRLYALFRPRFGRSVAPQTLHDLAVYLLDAARHVREPYRRFEARVRSLGEARSDSWRLLYVVLPDIVAARGRVYARANLPGQAESACTVSWQRGFRELLDRLLKKWQGGELDGFPTTTRRTAGDLRQLVELFRDWEADTLRFHLDVLARRKEASWPGYLGNLVRLAQFVGLNAEEALAFEASRSEGEARHLREQPSLGVPVSLCRDAGLFRDISLVQAARLAEDYQREGFLVSAEPIIFRPEWLSFLTTVYLPIPLLYAEHDFLIGQLATAGRSDHRFLKVASEWARHIQSERYFAQLDGQETASERPVITPEKSLDLLCRSAALLLEYYGALIHSGIPGVEPRQLEHELRILGQDPEEKSAGTVNIPERLRQVEQRLAALEADPTEHARHATLFKDLQELWRRSQIRHHLLRGEFALEQLTAAGTQPTSLGRLLTVQGPATGETAAAAYDARTAHSHYYLGNLALERGRPLEALDWLGQAARCAYHRDEVLYAKIQYHVARSLASMGLYAWASDTLERLTESHGVDLRDDPFFLLVQLARAVVDAHRYARSPQIVGKVRTRWLDPALRLAAEPTAPTHVKALVELTRAHYEEKLGADPERAREACWNAHILLQDAQTRLWQQLATQLELARLTRRSGRLTEAQELLNRSFLDRIRHRSLPGYLEACHTLARSAFAQADYSASERWWGRLLEVALQPDRLGHGGAIPDKLPAGLAGTEPLEVASERGEPIQASPPAGLERLLQECPCTAGVYIPWPKVLDAAVGLSDVFRVQATANEHGHVPSPPRGRLLQSCWIQAYHYLARPRRYFEEYLEKSEGLPLLTATVEPRTDWRVAFLKPHFPPLPAGTSGGGGWVTLRDAYRDLTGEGADKERAQLSPPLRRLKRQMYHAHARVHLGLSFFLPPAPAGEAKAATEEELIREVEGRPVLASSFPVTEYLQELRTLRPLDSLNSATIRAVCDCCRLFLLKHLFEGPTGGMATIYQRWLESSEARSEEETGIPDAACLLLLWAEAGNLGRLRVVLQGLLDRLREPGSGLSLPDSWRKNNPLAQLAQRLQREQDESPSAMESVQQEFLRLLGQLQEHLDDQHRPAARRRLLPVCFQLFPGEVRQFAVELTDHYEKALSALFSYPENDLYESVLNRLTILEALRDASLFFRERKRAIFETLRSNLGRVEQLFLDLDRLNNQNLTNWVKRSFFPHWDDVRKSLKEIQTSVRNLEDMIFRETTGQE